MRYRHTEHLGRYRSWRCRAFSATAATVAMGLGLSSGPPALASTKSISDVSAGMQRAEAVVAEYSKKPPFIAPGPAFNSKKLDSGKTLFSVPVDSQDQFVQILENDMQQVAKKVGIHFVDYSNSGDPSAWTAGMEQAVSEHANLIDLLAGINPEQLTPQLLQAKSAHVPVVASDAYSLGQKADPMLSGVMDVPYAEAGTIMADWTIVNSKGHAHALVIESNDVVSSPEEAGAAETAFHQNCSTCTVTVTNIPVADWASQTQTQVASYLRANPDTNYILPVYDSQSQYIAPAITVAGDSGKVHIVTYDGTAFVLDYMRKGQAVTMDVGEDLKWIAWAIMDQEMRIMAGLKPVPNEHTPMMIWTSHNIAQAGNPPQQSEGYGNGFITGYEKLWGLAS
jgi:ribose transport system substrate-binding protein